MIGKFGKYVLAAQWSILQDCGLSHLEAHGLFCTFWTYCKLVNLMYKRANSSWSENKDVVTWRFGWTAGMQWQRVERIQCIGDATRTRRIHDMRLMHSMRLPCSQCIKCMWNTWHTCYVCEMHVMCVRCMLCMWDACCACKMQKMHVKHMTHMLSMWDACCACIMHKMHVKHMIHMLSMWIACCVWEPQVLYIIEEGDESTAAMIAGNRDHRG